MIDISKERVNIECPSCGTPIVVTLREISFGVTITCKCSQKIHLVDKDGSAKKGIRDVNQAFSDLERAFKRIGK